MPTFKYIAIDENGKTIQSTSDQKDRTTLIDTLVKQKLRPVSIKETTSKKSTRLNANITLFKNKRVKSDQLVIFTRQLSAMVGAGVPLLRALSSLYNNQPANAPLKDILSKIVEDVEAGVPLNTALGKFPDTFDDIYVNMVQAGETAGILDNILDRLAIRQENSMSMRKKIRSAMAYPMVLLVVTVLAFFGLMIFIVPRIGQIITDLSGGNGSLPLITVIMLSISDFLIQYWYFIFGAIALIVIFTLRYIKTKSGRYNFHSILLKIPVVKTLVTKIVVANFARTFSALIEAGVSMLEAIDVTSRAVGNAVYEKKLIEAGELVKNGRTLSSVIAKDPMFPAIVSQMLAVGEETGQTGTVLLKIADFYEEEVNASISSLGSIIEPVMIVIMGGLVAMIAASVMLPIAQLSQNIQ